MNTAACKSAGIYIHIPFCEKKCGYCDFYSTTDKTFIPDFEKAISDEIKAAVTYPFAYDSVYFGGGTPSLLSEHSIRQIFDTVKSSLNPAIGSEFTIEVNPGAVDNKKIAAYKDMGFNRISLGIQSVDNKNLRFLTRIHTAERGLKALSLAREAGFTNMGVDMIYGLPGQTIQAWIKDLERVLAFNPEHLSCYMLTIEKGTPFHEAYKKCEFTPIADKTSADLYTATNHFLEERGYKQYEISNYARSEETISRHNMKYWDFVPYLGFGPSAHSFTGNTRFWNKKSITAYLGAWKENRSFIEDSEAVTDETMLLESIFLGLRKNMGIHIPSFESRTGVSFMSRYGTYVNWLVEKEMAVLSETRFRLTLKGMVVLDSIASDMADM